MECLYAVELLSYSRQHYRNVRNCAKIAPDFKSRCEIGTCRHLHRLEIVAQAHALTFGTFSLVRGGIRRCDLSKSMNLDI